MHDVSYWKTICFFSQRISMSGINFMGVCYIKGKPGKNYLRSMATVCLDNPKTVKLQFKTVFTAKTVLPIIKKTNNIIKKHIFL